MKKWFVLLPILIFLVVETAGARQQAESSPAASPARTVWDGVYTSEQATRGKQEYLDTCSRCHGATLQGTDGNGLQGKDFMDRWREDNVGSLYQFISENMPPARGRGMGRILVSVPTYLDIMSFVFSQNGFPAGPKPLTEDGLDNIRLQYKDGPRPLPNGALIWASGCLAGTDAKWNITGASEPLRTRSTDTKDYQEFHAAETSPVGSESYRLANLGFLGNSFRPENYLGKELLVKGNLVRPADPASKDPMRITVMAVRKVDDTCKK
jgi:mono/diheme cytochrome c family protein